MNIMRVKIYRESSGFWNVPDECRTYKWKEDLHLHEIEVPDSFHLAENGWGETILMDDKGHELEPMYIYREGDMPLDEPYIRLWYMERDPIARERYYNCRIL